MVHLRSRVVLLSLSLAAPVVGCIEATAHIPKACFRKSNIQVEPIVDRSVGLDGLGGTLRAIIEAIPQTLLPAAAVEETFRQDGLEAIPNAFRRLGFDGSIELLTADVVARTGLDSFGTFEEIELRVAPVDPTLGLEPARVARCAESDRCEHTPGSVRLEGEPGRDLVPYLEAGSLDLTLELEGRPPVWTWVFDIDVCVGSRARFAFAL